MDGSDEFALLLETLAHDEDVGAVVERVTASVRQPVTISGREVVLSASVGVAHPLDGEGAAELLRNADVAMYRAKARGKGRFAIFAPEMHVAAMERLELEADLRAGLARDEFRLDFQPLVDLATERIVGAEALVRWEHPTRGLLRPAAFIPVAEQTGLIVSLGRWVLDEACRQARSWEEVANEFGEPVPWVSVNISGRQLQEPAFADEIAELLTGCTLTPTRLVLEITESVLLHDAEGALAKLHEIKRLGVRIALDDFGTGYSSLAYLQRFPIDVLKMDKSFTEGLGGEAAEPALPRAIVGLGRSLGMQTVAEGIEVTAQFGRLRQLGCDIGQGFLFAHPSSATDFRALLDQRAEG
jgi:predicted signal transduction protein with EAL and GGDEF domain